MTDYLFRNCNKTLVLKSKFILIQQYMKLSKHILSALMFARLEPVDQTLGGSRNEWVKCWILG